MAIKTNLSDMQIGDKIACEYTASLGVFGTFANLGSAVKAELPLVSTDVPDGTFYFIHTGYDFKGRIRLIADRNIQNSISWDTLNTAGVISGLPLWKTDTNYNFTLRLLTGGISSTDLDNEWDKIIVGSTLNGTITAGDSNIWHWNTKWCLTSTSADTSTRVVRGYSTVGQRSSVTTSEATISSENFRPVLLVDSLNTPPTDTLSVNATSTDITPIIISGNITDVNDTIQYRILLNSSTFQDWTVLSASPVNVSKTINISDLQVGSNALVVEYKDSKGVLASWTQTITLNSVNKYLIVDSGIAKTYNNSLWVEVGSLPITASMAYNNGMDNLSALTNSVLQQLSSPTFKLVLWKNK